MLEIDLLQGAIVTSYGSVFSDGPRKVARDKVPLELRETHDALIDLRNKRFAHHDHHESFQVEAELEVKACEVRVQTSGSLLMAFGAPEEWEVLFAWLDGYLLDQAQKQLRRLSDKTGYQWVMPSAPPPAWLR